MSYTEEQIITSLPPALQGELKQFGALEAKDPDTLYVFMQDMRRKYHIPPWHAFTLLIQRAAYATGMAGRGITRENLWYSRQYNSDDAYTLEIEPKQNWVDMVAEGYRKDGSLSGSVRMAVQPSTKRVWLMASEKLHSDAKHVWLRTPEGQPAKNYCGRISMSIVFAEAARCLRKGKTESSIQCTIRTCSRRPKIPKPWQKPVEDVVTPEVETINNLPDPPETTATTTPAEQHFVLSAEQHEVVLTVFELAAAKARELGMHSTIMRWRNVLSTVIGNEVSHVQE